MSRANPYMRDLAERLIACEVNGNKGSGTKTPAAFKACEKLRPHLATLMGNAGFRSLLSRSLALANEEVRWLHAVHVKADGALAGLAELETQVDAKEFTEGGVVLLAQLLGLLSAFIGESLTLRQMREVWPELSHNDLVFNSGDKNEKAK